jgi:hypothetical protein
VESSCEFGIVPSDSMKCLGNYRVALHPVASPVVLRSIELVSYNMSWAGHVARMKEKSNSYRLLVGEPEGKRPLGR